MKKLSRWIELGLRYVLWIGTILFGQLIYNKWIGNSNSLIDRLSQVDSILQSNYFDNENIDQRKMEDNAIKAYVDALNDPYTVYLDTDTNSWFQQELKWEQDFEWIWAVVSKKDYYVMIEEVLKGSPAFKAWLYPLDRIIAIWTGSTKELTVNEAVGQIRWPKGSIITLTIERIKKDNTKEIIIKKVTRDKISVPSVSNTLIEKDKKIFAHITISIFWEETENLFKQIVEEIKQKNVDGIILDLRGNGWGLLPIAVEIASHFIEKEKIIVSSKYRSLDEEQFFSEGYGDLENIPTTVLVDEMSASASEILALALQEQTNTKIIGKQSFGKGSIQTLFEFIDGASIKYTIGKRYSPSGKNIDKIWVNPDIIVDFDIDQYKQTKKDTQLEKAIETLQKQK